MCFGYQGGRESQTDGGEESPCLAENGHDSEAGEETEEDGTVS